jgi:hypothetical protein
MIAEIDETSRLEHRNLRQEKKDCPFTGSSCSAVKVGACSLTIV